MNNRKLLRNFLYHKNYKCKNCGSSIKFYKEITLSKPSTIKDGKEDIKIFHNVFWCKNCKSIYELKKAENQNETVAH